MFEHWTDVIEHQKKVQKLSTEALGKRCGVSRATAFRWAAGFGPPWFDAARELLFGGLESVVDRWGEHAGHEGTLDFCLALDGSGVVVVHAGVEIARAQTLAAAIEAASAFLDAAE